MDSELDAHTPTSSSNRPHSIDLTLELERELDNESEPPTSPVPQDSTNDRPQSLDGNVLASIVTQLRISLENVTRERDDLLHHLDQAAQKQADLRNSLQLVTDRSSQLEEQLSAAQGKNKEDEEAISMLRAKVEESRRGLMRLQTESRRMSNLAIDSSRAPPVASKRMSLISPIPSSPVHGHRRFSSQSDASFILGNSDEHGQLPSPSVNFGDSSPPVALSSRRFSAMMYTTSSDNQMEMLRKELKNTRDELEETRHELAEANEAREASDQCAKALRDYISENAVGESGSISSAVSPQPSSTVNRSDDLKGSKWNFKIWNGASFSTAAAPAVTAGPNSSGSSPQITSPALSRKIGSFFGSRGGSISSISSTMSQPTSQLTPILPQLPSMYRGGSDASSMEDEEPVSPDTESEAPVVVRDNSEASDIILNDQPKGKGGYQATPDVC